jgi:hypothetical protein
MKSLGWGLINAEHDLDRRKITGAVMLKNNPDGKYDEVNVLKERVNMSAWEDRFDRDTVVHGDDDDEEKTAGNYMYEKPDMSAVMGDITDAVMLNMEYEASTKVNQGRELNMYEKPEMREMMIETNPNGKHDEVNVVRERDIVRQGLV